MFIRLTERQPDGILADHRVGFGPFRLLLGGFRGDTCFRCKDSNTGSVFSREANNRDGKTTKIVNCDCGQEFTYSTENVARYYRTYLDLIRHWDAVLPGFILRVFYEDVVEDLERNVRRILEFCRLEFEPACVEFYKTERSVRTASSEQVRQPIFREGLFQWRSYEPWLGPLKDALGDAPIRYRE